MSSLLLLLLSLAYSNGQTTSLNVLGDTVYMKNNFVQLSFNLTQGSLSGLWSDFEGGGNFTTSTNLCGTPSTSVGGRRGCLVVSVFSSSAMQNSSTSDIDRPSPVPLTVLSNSTDSASFSVTLSDSLNLVEASLTLGMDANSRSVWVQAEALTLQSFASPLISVDWQFSPPSSLAHYAKGIRQAMNLPFKQAYIASASPLQRFYALGDGTTGCVEVLADVKNTPTPTYMFAGPMGGGALSGGIASALFGSPSPLDVYTEGFGGTSTNGSFPQGLSSPALTFYLFPNEYSFPPSNVPPSLPSHVNVTDLRSILTAAHGNAAAPLHSYDFYPETRASPCLLHGGVPCFGCGSCYGNTWNCKFLHTHTLPPSSMRFTPTPTPTLVQKTTTPTLWYLIQQCCGRLTPCFTSKCGVSWRQTWRTCA